ncbi:dnaJ homolog subfamily C member 2-like [Actinia tenebrosa]|uniref:DnaJ homolog subfamily C member 2 n=1 Tax=Actinia tenebrosa TaxID=6105 RepID=A0A6P8IGU4_ACTTE|nr:dnaJ homolog subfamily C member 2-like [Actinia tenebrosa]
MLELPPAFEDETTTTFARISAPVLKPIEPVGRWYEAYINHRHHSSLSHHSIGSVDDEASSSDESITSDDEDDTFLLMLDPKDWKDQDHYRVLGLTKLRYKATEDQVKKAFKKKVLKHHPDKKKSRGEKASSLPSNNQDYFSCITIANEVLSSANRRRAYDSVDPTFDDVVPTISSNNKANFFDVFCPVIESNARWSNIEPVPLLGHENSTFEEVDKFYTFWYNFDSWREFSYLDEEEKEKGENRDERRWIEKQNKAMRQKRKKEEVTRIRTLIDNAYACDPRIKRFKEEEKERKLAEKRAKEEAAKAAAEEKIKKKQEAEEAERLAKEKEEQEAKLKAATAKKEKEKLKAAMKKERKAIRTVCKNHNYFCEEEPKRLEEMQQLDLLLESLSLENLQTFREDMEKGETKEQVYGVYQQQIEALKERRRKEEENQKATLARSKKESEEREEQDQWTIEQTQLLVKAVNLFPAGTVSRWRVIADYINDHSKAGKPREPKHVIKKVKTLQKSDASLKDECNKNAFSKFDSSLSQTKTVPSESVPTVRYDEKAPVEKPWSSNEQKLLEEALRKFPANTPERWDRIAESIPGRTKKECMKRYKELVEMIKAKKAAAQAKPK